MKSHPGCAFVIFCLCLSGYAHGAECTKDEAFAAETVTDYLDSWENVFRFFKAFGHCYDGGIAEGAGYRIQKLWTSHWSQLPTMIALTKRDPEFKAFIWDRIGDETFSQDDFSSLLHKAKSGCPKVAQEFCQAVIQEAERHAAQPSAPGDAR